jgi:hypothetical protein
LQKQFGWWRIYFTLLFAQKQKKKDKKIFVIFIEQSTLKNFFFQNEVYSKMFKTVLFSAKIENFNFTFFLKTKKRKKNAMSYSKKKTYANWCTKNYLLLGGRTSSSMDRHL